MPILQAMMFDAGSVHPYGSFWLDFADKAIKGFAVIVGGAWTWLNYLRSRTHKRRLEPKVSGQLFKKGEHNFLFVDCSLKNVGQSKYPIQREGTAVEVVGLGEEGRSESDFSDVFLKHDWIEPSEEITDPKVIAIDDPDQFVAFEVTLRVVSASTTSEAIEWNASCIVSSYLSDSKKDGTSKGNKEP